MSTHNAKSSGRRSGRGRRRNRDRNDHNDRNEYSPRSGNTTTAPSAPKAPQKQSFWQKIVSFFTGKKTGANGKSSKPAAQYPPYRGGSAPEAKGATTAPAPAPRPARKPEAVEVTTPKLYVGNLSFDASESDLFELFGGVGAVKNSEIVSHKETEKSKGFGFVTMATIEEAKRAVEVLHDKEFMGRKLVVSGAKTPVERS